MVVGEGLGGSGSEGKRWSRMGGGMERSTCVERCESDGQGLVTGCGKAWKG